MLNSFNSNKKFTLLHKIPGSRVKKYKSKASDVYFAVSSSANMNLLEKEEILILLNIDAPKVQTEQGHSGELQVNEEDLDGKVEEVQQLDKLLERKVQELQMEELQKKYEESQKEIKKLEIKLKGEEFFKKLQEESDDYIKKLQEESNNDIKKLQEKSKNEIEKLESKVKELESKIEELQEIELQKKLEIIGLEGELYHAKAIISLYDY